MTPGNANGRGSVAQQDARKGNAIPHGRLVVPLMRRQCRAVVRLRLGMLAELFLEQTEDEGALGRSTRALDRCLRVGADLLLCGDA